MENTMATKETTATQDGLETRALQSTALSAGDVPGEILIAPWGKVESSNGSFVVDDESAAAAVRAFEQHATDLPIDYEHQTLGGTYSSPSGEAPAAGWIKRLRAEPGIGLLAEIEWTPRAKQMLAAREYRYLSPVAVIRKTDRKLVAIHSAALTNKPAIVGMQPIVNRAHVTAEAESDETMALLRAELDLGADADTEEVLVAAGRRLCDLRRQAERRRIDQRIHEAMQAGKLVEAQRAWAEALVAREEDLFDEWFRTAPVLVMPGRSTPPNVSESHSRRGQSAATRARAEFRANPLLSRLTTEEAFVADAIAQSAA